MIAYFVVDGGAMMSGGDADTSINVEATSASPAPAAPAQGGTETQATQAEGGTAPEPRSGRSGVGLSARLS